MASSPGAMRFFELGPEEGPEGGRRFARVEGRHRWQLPARIGCPECGVYGAIGPSYPTVDLTGWHEATSLTDPPGVSWRQFREVAERLAVFLGWSDVPPPGSTFGPFDGTVRGDVADLTIGHVAFLFSTEAACSQMTRAGVSLPGTAPANVKGRRATMPTLLEVELPRAGRLSAASYGFMPRRCGTCDRSDSPLQRAVLEALDVPADMDLFRPANHATVLLASERFRNAVMTCELTGLIFTEVEIAASDA